MYYFFRVTATVKAYVNNVFLAFQSNVENLKFREFLKFHLNFLEFKNCNIISAMWMMHFLVYTMEFITRIHIFFSGEETVH